VLRCPSWGASACRVMEEPCPPILHVSALSGAVCGLTAFGKKVPKADIRRSGAPAVYLP
jgi:hypothetical protein